MTTTTGQLDAVMEAASGALARMDYLACEGRCLEALAIAHQCRDWSYYARILMPLQEARRQRRMIAAEGVVRLGTAHLHGDPSAWLAHMRTGNTQADTAGCIVLTQPHTADDAHRLVQTVRDSGLCVEVLLADNPVTIGQWTLRAYAHEGPNVNCTISAPPADWLDQWLVPENDSAPSPDPGSQPTCRPVDWFLDAAEALGNAAIAQVHTPLGDPQRVDALERCLNVVTDHEKLHQALEEAARAATRSETTQ